MSSGVSADPKQANRQNQSGIDMIHLVPSVSDLYRDHDTIVQEVNPEQITLFGSHARGDTSQNSDIG